VRAVFDTSTVVPALLFPGKLKWLRAHWKQRQCVALVSNLTAAELLRVLAYPKFGLTQDERLELLSDYLPYCETVEVMEACPVKCRDPHDQPFLDLAESGKAEVLVSSDFDLLALKGQTRFAIESAESYRILLEA
jgi:putative PIN family toxin of toxin-antitoxin system